MKNLKKKIKLEKGKIRTIEAILEKNLIKNLGAIYGAEYEDSIDCCSELASGGTTTDTYQVHCY